MSKTKQVDLAARDWAGSCYQGLDIKQGDITDFDVFLRTGKTAHVWGEFPVFQDDIHTTFTVRNGLVCQIGHWSDSGVGRRNTWVFEGLPSKCDTAFGVIVAGRQRGYQHFFLSNSDEAGVVCKTKSMCGVSFLCVGRLVFPQRAGLDSANYLNLFREKRTTLLDFIPDVTIKAKTSEKEWVRKFGLASARAKYSPPKAGFTLLWDGLVLEWHQSSTVLFKVGSKTYLVGQDEGTYFGCQLQGNPTTVKAAFTDLMPKSVRGRRFMRQGEWFAVAANKVPPIEKCCAEFTGLNLPRDGENSATHRLHACDDGRIAQDGSIFLSGGELVHSKNEHASLEFPEGKWKRLARNTAVRSISVEGVD